MQRVRLLLLCALQVTQLYDLAGDTEYAVLRLIPCCNTHSLNIELGCCCCVCVLQVTKLCDLAGDSVCSVSWSQRGTYLSVGTNTGEVQVSQPGHCWHCLVVGGCKMCRGCLDGSWEGEGCVAAERCRGKHPDCPVFQAVVVVAAARRDCGFVDVRAEPG